MRPRLTFTLTLTPALLTLTLALAPIPLPSPLPPVSGVHEKTMSLQERENTDALLDATVSDFMMKVRLSEGVRG